MELHMNENYRVNLSVFEGPLDLLLYLIKKNDLDVYDIPVSLMLDKYMEYLDSLRELDIDLAGEFLLMAAELAHIKSRLLLPQDEGAIEEDEADPRADLVRRLLEYQQYRLAAETLEKRTQLGRDVFVPLQPERVEAAEGPLEADVFELMTAFGRILKRIPADQYHAVAVDRISVNARILQLTERIKKDVTITLEELLVFALSDLIGESDSRELFFKHFKVTGLKQVDSVYVLTGYATGSEMLPELGGTTVKAVTHHECSVKKEGNIWTIRVLLDI